MMKTVEVITPEELVRAEQEAVLRGCREEEFMERAGLSLANGIETLIRKESLHGKVFLVAGKGNNGGDGYVTARLLLQRGFAVEAFTPYREESLGDLCRSRAELFKAAGGKIHGIAGARPPSQEALLIDALTGTGFKGRAEGELAAGIDWVNRSDLPVVAIDIPSGLCSSTGTVETVAVRADVTFYLEYPKIGFFLGDGWNHVGVLKEALFGLPEPDRKTIRKEALLVPGEGIETAFPPVKRTRNKYDAGYVVAVAGSDSMRGAGALCSLSALRSGAGIVRWFCLGSSEPKVGAVEVITSLLEEDENAFFHEMTRASALLIGPGIGKDRHAMKIVKKILSRCKTPSVIDADALFFLAKKPSYSIPSNAVLTPHRGEWERLLKPHRLGSRLMGDSQTFVDKKQTRLLLKGAPSFLFSPGRLPFILPFGNPGMATAGSGDVLSGIIAALLAQKLDPTEAVILGSFLHGLAGDAAAKDRTVRSMIASDLIESLPAAFQEVLGRSV